jgi:6-phosphogluconolactonase
VTGDVVRAEPPNEPRVLVARDPADLANTAARMVVEWLAEALAQPGDRHLALSGGSTPAALYRVLASDACRGTVDWSRVHLWLEDERWVPPDDPDSNARMVREMILPAGGAVEGARLHVFDTGSDDREDAARRYGEEFRRSVPAALDGTPIFDVLLAGIGPDGHTLSLFPGSPWLAPAPPDPAALCVAVPAPRHIEPRLPRITLTVRVLVAARATLVVASGASKAEVVAEILGSPRPAPSVRPAVLLRRPDVTWLLDRSAAARR